MNDETISALGLYSKELLSAENFQALIHLFSQQCATDVLGTKPNDASAREQIYASYLGFENFLSLMKKFADAYDKLVKEQYEQVQAPDDDPSVHDIYRTEAI